MRGDVTLWSENARTLSESLPAGLKQGRFDRFFGVADGPDPRRCRVSNLDSELFLPGHDQLDEIEAVRAEILRSAHRA